MMVAMPSPRAAVLLLLPILLCATAVHAGGRSEPAGPEPQHIVVVTPDAVDAHPLYEMAVSAVTSVVEDTPGLELEVIRTEGRGDERLLESSRNPRVELMVIVGGALLETAAELADAQPATDFLLVDGDLRGREHVAALRINRREQAFLAGYVAGLRVAPQGGSAAPSRRPGESPPSAGLLLETGLRQGEEIVRPAYILGVRAAAGENTIRTERLPLGAAPSVLRARLAGMEQDGIPVLLPSLYSNRSVVAQALRESTLDLIWLDERSPDSARGRTLVALPLHIEDTLAEMVTEVLEAGAGAVETREESFPTGGISLYVDTGRYTAAFDAETRRRIERMAQRLETGELSLRMPEPAF